MQTAWQNPYVDRVIGSIRRDCLYHVIVLNERQLRRILREYFNYYHSCRTHLSLSKDPPFSRPAKSVEAGNIVSLPRVAGLHHRYTRIVAYAISVAAAIRVADRDLRRDSYFSGRVCQPCLSPYLVLGFSIRSRMTTTSGGSPVVSLKLLQCTLSCIDRQFLRFPLSQLINRKGKVG